MDVPINGIPDQRLLVVLQCGGVLADGFQLPAKAGPAHGDCEMVWAVGGDAAGATRSRNESPQHLTRSLFRLWIKDSTDERERKIHRCITSHLSPEQDTQDVLWKWRQRPGGSCIGYAPSHGPRTATRAGDRYLRRRPPMEWRSSYTWGKHTRQGAGRTAKPRGVILPTSALHSAKCRGE